MATATRPVTSILGCVAALAACGPGAGTGSEPDAGGTLDTVADAAVDASNGDDAFVPSCDPCELVSQCGCSPGEACDLDRDPTDGSQLGDTVCRAVTLAGQQGDTCTGNTTCDVGLVCEGPVGHTACHEYCDQDADCGEGACGIELHYGDTPLGIMVCSTPCDVLDGTGCPPDWGCHSVPRASGGAFSDCYGTGLGGQGTSCEQQEDCLPSYTCAVIQGGGSECLKNCRISDPAIGCEGEAGTNCVQFIPPAIIDGVEYGLCL